jgi:glycine/D-amino acid oxidase-like deaminating enzyme
MNTPPKSDRSYDVAVVGGGIAGLTTALLLARGGRAVVVLEAREVGAGTTGRSTGKVSLLQGTKLARASRTNPPEAVHRYVEAGREGQAWLRHFCATHGLPVDGRDATTYAVTETGERRARRELEVARAAGLDVGWVTETELPFPVRGAVRLADQFQVDPAAVVRALRADVEAAGGVVREHARVRSVDHHDDGVRLRLTDGEVRCGVAVIATNQPIGLRGLFFARLTAQRSYAATLTSPWIPEGMHLSADDEVRSLRSVHQDGADLLMVGGSGHVTGRGSAPAHRDALLDWAVTTFAGAEVRRAWSAQDQSPASGLPYVGPVVPGDHRIQVVTGFDKWGLSTAPAAALLLAADLLDGTPPSWGTALRSWTPRQALAAGRAALANAEVGWQMACGHAQRLLRHDQRPLCTHLGGVLAWNDAEQTWDCPLHGSRFGTDGEVLDGPATRALG